MRRKPAFVLLLANLTIVGLLISTVYPAVATTYSPSVKAGDFVKYGTVSASFSSNVSGTPTPQFIKDLQAASSFRLDVQSISGTNATEKVTESFSNGTSDKIQFVNWDVQSLQGNVSGSNFLSVASLPLLVAGGLTTNDKICTGTSGPCNGSFNQTQTRTYAGAPRSVNTLILSMSSSGSSTSVTGYWDQATGVLDEISFSFSFTSGSPANKQTFAFGLTATQTSLWSATILGLSPLIFYGIIGAIAAVVVILAAIMLMRRRKPSVTPTPTTPGTSAPGP